MYGREIVLPAGDAARWLSGWRLPCPHLLSGEIDFLNYFKY
jgi:hypothetical protein